MTSIRVHAAPRDIIKEAVVKMDAVMASFTFTDPKIKAAAAAFVDRYRSEHGEQPRPLRRHGGARRAAGQRRAHARARHGLHDRAGDADRGRALGIRLEDMILITGDRLREPVGVRADRDRRHRADDEGGCAGATGEAVVMGFEL